MIKTLQGWGDSDKAAIISGKARVGNHRPGRNSRDQKAGIKFMSAAALKDEYFFVDTNYGLAQM